MAQRDHMPDAKPTFISTFSGLGGLDLGLEHAGFAPVGSIELDGVARSSIFTNRPAWRTLTPHDIVAAAAILTPRMIGLRKHELAMLVGGPPCQPFSKAAQWSSDAMQGMRDPRARCLTGFFRLVETFMPRVILIENVQGFLAGKANALQRIKARLGKLNRENGTRYKLQHWVVNAADYGVPQRRVRAILFAARNGDTLSLPHPTHLNAPITAWDAIGEVNVDRASLPPQAHWGKLLPSIPEGRNYLWHTPRGGGMPLFGYRTRFWSFLLKLAKSEPSWTIPAQPGPYTGPFHWENRALSIAELLRLQSFPATWKVCGTFRDQVRQIGNATPPLLAEVFGRAIAAQIFEIQIPDVPVLTISRSCQATPATEPLRSVPKEFQKFVQKWPDHPGTGRGPQPVSIRRESNGETTTKTATAGHSGSKERGRRERSRKARSA